MRLGMLLVVLAGVACIPEQTVPQGLRCDEGANRCPQGLVCNRLHRCVPEESLDLEGPRLVGTASVQPGSGGRGQTFRVIFEVSKPLGGTPRVTADAHGNTLLFEVDAASTSETHVEATFTPGTDTAEGEAVVYVDLEDRSGNPLVAPLGVSFVLDFTPPSFIASVSPRQAKVDDTVVVTLISSEPLSGPPAVAVSPPGFALGDAAPAGLTYAWSRRVARGDARGPFMIRASAQDPAGNAADAVSVGMVEVDSVLPWADAATVAPALARSGTIVTASFTASEPLREGSLVRAGDQPMDCVPLGLRVTCRVAVEGSPGEDGPRRVVAELADLFGNVALQPVGEVGCDFTPPLVASAQVSPLLASVGQTVLVTLTATEPLAGRPVLVAAPELVFTFTRQEGNTYLYERQVQASDAETTYTFSADALTDLAGNDSPRQSLAPILEIDSRPPSVASSSVCAATEGELTCTPLPIGARRGTVLTVVLTASEPLAASPDVRLGTVRLDLASSAGLAYTFRLDACPVLPCGNLPEGPQLVTASLRDRAGNLSFQALDEVNVDVTPPSIASAFVGYGPAADNPLGVVSAATVGTTIAVTLVAGEALDTAIEPTLTASDGITLLPLALVPGSFGAGGATFEGQVPQGAGDGDYRPSLSWTDQAGNAATDLSFSSPPIRVKTSRPTLSVAQGQVLYLRSPWGDAASEGAIPPGPYFALAPADGDAATLAASTFTLTSPVRERPCEAPPCPPVLPDAPTPIARVRIWADGSRTSLLGTAAPGPGGSWPRQRLASLDTPAIYVTGVDLAGNESAPVKIENGEWVATPNPVTQNPHRLEISSYAEVVLRPDPGRSRAAGSGGEGLGGGVVLARAEAVWRERISGSVPGARYSHAMAYDSARGRVVLFGGREPLEQDTWEWDGRTWAEKTPVGPNPSGRAYHALAYDSGRGRVVLFGGNDRSDLNDLWEWDGVRWEKKDPPGPAPGPHVGHAMAYDSGRGRMVVYGNNRFGVPGELWEWDGARWELRTPSGAAPSQRTLHALAYDSARGRVVMFGGSENGTILQDLWEWDGASWISAPVSGDWPGPRWSFQMGYDSGRRRVVLFGGRGPGPDFAFLEDTWEWDGARWEQRSGAAPPGRTAGAMAYDAAGGRMVLFGGYRDGALGDVWSWDGVRWVDRTRWISPGPQFGHAMVYDPAKDRTVLIGNGGVWEWDGDAWTEVSPYGAPRSGAATAYDGARGRVVLFGGQGGGPFNEFNELWEWRDGTWVDRTPQGTNPPERHEAALAWDGRRQRLVLFGGYSGLGLLQDTWELESTEWVERTPSGPMPSARSGHALVYDQARERTVLFGGQDSGGQVLSDVWEWDGTDWVERVSLSALARWQHAMTYDSARKRVLLFGGAWFSGILRADFWTWDGAQWADETPAGTSPIRRSRHAMVFDPVRKVAIVHGGTVDGTFRADHWELDARTERQPAVQFVASAAAAGLDPAAVNGLRVRARCGGAFAPYGSGDVGATLWGWVTGGPGALPGQWQELDANSAGVQDGGAFLDWTAPAGGAWRRHFLERDQQLAFQCRPAGISGGGRAEVALDYIEVRVRYVSP